MLRSTAWAPLPPLRFTSTMLDLYNEEKVLQTSNCFFFFDGTSQVVLVVKNPPANAGDVRDTGLIPGLGKSPGRRYGNLLQFFCLENLMDRGAWRATVHGVTKNWTQLKWLNIHVRQVKSLWLEGRKYHRKHRDTLDVSEHKHNTLLNTTLDTTEVTWMLGGEGRGIQPMGARRGWLKL